MLANNVSTKDAPSQPAMILPSTKRKLSLSKSKIPTHLSDSALREFANEIDSEDDSFISDNDTVDLNTLTPAQQLIEEFVDLAGDKNASAKQIEAFLQQHATSDFDINARSANQTRAIDCAAETGSYSTFKYLIEVAKVSCINEKECSVQMLMFNIPIHQKLKAKLFQEHRLWERQQDGLNECHFAAWVGDHVKLNTILMANPYYLLVTTHDDVSVLECAHLSENQETITLVESLTAQFMHNLQQDHAIDMLRDLTLITARHKLWQETDTEALAWLEKALYLHHQAIFDTSIQTTDRIKQDLLTAHHLAIDSLSSQLYNPQPHIVGDYADTMIHAGARYYTLPNYLTTLRKKILLQTSALNIAFDLLTRDTNLQGKVATLHHAIIEVFSNLIDLNDTMAQQLLLNTNYANALLALEVSYRCLNTSFAILGMNKDEEDCTIRNGKEEKLTPPDLAENQFFYKFSLPAPSTMEKNTLKSFLALTKKIIPLHTALCSTEKKLIAAKKLPQQSIRNSTPRYESQSSSSHYISSSSASTSTNSYHYRLFQRHAIAIEQTDLTLNHNSALRIGN